MDLTPFNFGTNELGRSWTDPFGESTLGFNPMGQNMMSNYNQPTTDLGPIMRRQGREMIQFRNILHADLIETETGFEVHCDLPGCDKDDLDIEIVDGCLLIKAERKHIHSKDTDTVHTMERSFGSVSRKIQLPGDADLDSVTTDFTFGVLNVTFPKKESTTIRRKLQIL